MEKRKIMLETVRHSSGIEENSVGKKKFAQQSGFDNFTQESLGLKLSVKGGTNDCGCRLNSVGHGNEKKVTSLDGMEEKTSHGDAKKRTRNIRGEKPKGLSAARITATGVMKAGHPTSRKNRRRWAIGKRRKKMTYKGKGARLS